MVIEIVIGHEHNTTLENEGEGEEIAAALHISK
jgi:hypothetical protein